MAGEIIDPLVTPEKSEFHSRNMGKNSAGNPGSPPVAPVENEFYRTKMGKISARNSGSLSDGISARGHHRRASVDSYHTGGKPDSASIRQQIVPHYLRASTGSCHDICKYGGRHVFDETARKPLRKRTVKPSSTGLNSVEIIVSGEQKKEKVVKHERSLVKKPSPDIKSYLPKLKASFDAKTSSSRRSASSSNQTCLPNSPTRRSTSSYPPEIIKREILLPSEKVEEGNSIDKKMSRTDKRTHDESVKHSSSVKSKAVKVKPSSASDNPDGIRGKGRRNSDVKTGRNATVSTLSAKKALVPSAAPLSPKISLSKTASSETRKTGRLKLLSPLKDRNRMHKVETETSNSKDSEKTLHVIKTGTDNTALESTPDNHNTVSMEIGKVQPVKENHDKNLRMGTEKNTLESIPDDHALLALPAPSSPNSLSHEVDEDNKYSGNEPNEFVSDNTVSVEIDKVQPVKENNKKTLRVVAENNILESIPDEHVISALPSPSSPTSLSHTKSQSSLSHKDDEDVNYSGNEADEFVSVNTIYMEIGKVQPVKEYHNKILLMGTENDALEAIPDDNANPAFPSPSSSESLSPSLLSEEEDDEEIEHSGGEADVFDSDNSVSMVIGEVQPVEDNHNKTLRKSRAVVSKDKFCSPVKLKFRSGRIVELPPVNNSPRRLKFRRARFNGNTIDDLASDNKNSPDDKKSVEIGNVQPTEENQDKTLRKNRVIASKDKYRSPLKLYRSEKVVDLQSDNHSPMRLRFRRPRDLMAGGGKGDLRTRAFKKDGGEDDAAGAGLSSRNVILKHQDMQGKRDARGLFNNVIEETASKLVESRKSKVKALVGAFETLISLQERKPPRA